MTIDLEALEALLTAVPKLAGNVLTYEDEKCFRVDEDSMILFAQPAETWNPGLVVDEGLGELVVAAVNALPALLAIAKAAYAWQDRYEEPGFERGLWDAIESARKSKP